MVERTQKSSETRCKLLDAAMHVIRLKGYSATTVDDICREAGLTKGSFFHHFASKQELAVAAAAFFGEMAAGLFASAPYRSIEDPLERVLGYIDFRIAILRGELPDFTCLVGTMVQETYETQPDIRAACDRTISGHADDVARDIESAKQRYAPDAPWTSPSLALHTQAVLQGAFILAKARRSPDVAVDSVRHLRRYIELLFQDVPGGSETDRPTPKEDNP